MTTTSGNTVRAKTGTYGLRRILGISFGLAGIKATGFTGILDQMARQTEEGKQKLVQAIPEVRALRAILTLTDEKGRSYVDMLREMAKASDGCKDAMAKVRAARQAGAGGGGH